MGDICTDNRFELIEKYKKELIESTNIETSQDEMTVLDNLLFRFWQMGWLDRLEQTERSKDGGVNMDDLISRQAAIQAILDMRDCYNGFSDTYDKAEIIGMLEEVPTAEPTLYGYKIEHLVYIATVMEKEGVTAEYAVRTFDDMGRAIKMVIEEAHAKIEEALNG